jgi:membrane protease YdiL (CAAX protease family)
LIAIYIIVFFAVWTLRATFLFGIDERIAPAFVAIYSNGVKFLLWVLPAVLYLKYIDRVRPFPALLLVGDADRAGLINAIGVSVIFLALVVMTMGVTDPDAFRRLAASDAGGWMAAIGGVSISAMLEEILFRGFLLPGVAGRLGFTLGNVAVSILFVLIHWPNWIWTGSFGAGKLVVSGSILLLSLVLGYTVRWSRSIWPAILLHIMNNVLSALSHP